ncbi:MAG: type IV pilus assembly protein PilM [Verrucomicrobia bacterium]|nr:type IV pilus assembly protein PilM [Verrucomicrobiota bacterium]
MAAKRFLTLDIGASTLKLAEFTSTGNDDLTLVNFGKTSLELDPSSEEDRNPFIVAALRKLIAGRQFRSHRVGISVSSQQVLTKFMKLPATDESKIRQMVRYEAAQTVPFPMEEVVWDYQVVGLKGESDLEVMLVAIKNDIIEGFNGCVEDVGLSVEVADVSPVAVYNAILYNCDVDQGCTLLLDIGARTTNLIFLEPNKVFSRNIPIAGNTVTQNVAQEFEISFAEAENLKVSRGFVGLGGAYEEPEDETAAKLSKIIRNVMTRLHAEVARSINFYKAQQHGTPPQRLLLAGGTSITTYADHFFKEKMEIDVQYFNPFHNVSIQVPPEELEKVAHSMGEVVGLGLRMVTECPIEINLVPPTVTRRRQFMRKIPFFAVSMIGILCIVMSWWLYFWRVTDLLTNHRDQVAREVNDLQQVESKLKAAESDDANIKMQVRQIQKVIWMRYFWLEFLDDFNQQIPKDIWITQLTPQRAGSPLSYSGAAPAAGSSSGGGRSRLRGGPAPGMGPPGMMPPDGFDGGPAAPTEPAAASKSDAAAASKGITEFEIRGLCLNDRRSAEPLKPVEDFQKKLEHSRYFKEVEILESISPAPTDWTFTFRLKAKLKDPILY